MELIGPPPSGDPYLTKLAAVLREALFRKEPLVVGSRHNGTDWKLRYRAPLHVPWIQVHVQSTVVGEGGIVAYDPATYKSSTLVDCRANRLQDVTVAALVAGKVYVMWLIPVQYDGAGLKVLFDGQGGRPDYASFATMGL